MADANRNALARALMEAPPYNALAQFDQPMQPNALARGTLKPGPEPTGYDRLFDGIYGALGGTPDRRALAEALSGAANVGTLGMATGAYDGAKELAQTGQPSSLAMALMPGAKVAGAGAQAATQAAKKGIRAFHGSPHDFDRFDLSKIGTGEGAQAYGHGLYFAEAEDVARSYRDALADKSKVAFGGAAPSNSAAVALHRNQYDFDKTLADLQSAVQANRGFGDEKTVALLEKDIAEITALRGKPMDSPGKMYEVNIKADPEDFLDWDKPLSEQSEKVKALFPNLPPETQGMELYRAAQGLETRERPQLTGDPMRDFISQGWHDAGAKTGTKKRASEEVLKNAGIPGIRYLDQGSRGAGEGSRNYVAFDDSLIEILRKYGLLPPAVAGGVAASQSDAQAGQ